jgi:cation diffusion facilitator family transporter
VIDHPLSPRRLPDHDRSPEPDRANRATRVTAVGSIVNVALAATKLAAGILGSSAAMVADAVHSLSDFGTDLVVLVTMRIARTPPDASHHYGHGKFETLGALAIGFALAAAAGGMGFSSTRTIVAFYRGVPLPRPGMIALAAAAVSIAAKEIMFHATRRVARSINSPALEANGWHHRSDALSSVGAFLGIGGAALLGPGFRVLDPIAGLAISAIVFRVAFRILWGALGELTEASGDPAARDKVAAIALEVAGISDPHRIRTRRVGPYSVIDLHARVDGGITLRDAHARSHDLQDALVAAFGEGTIVTIHIEPEL